MKKNKLARKPKALQAAAAKRVPRKAAAKETLPVGWKRESDWRYNRVLGDVELAVVKVSGVWRPILDNQQTGTSGFASPVSAMRACERRALLILSKALKELAASYPPSGNAVTTPKRKTNSRRAKRK